MHFPFRLNRTHIATKPAPVHADRDDLPNDRPAELATVIARVHLAPLGWVPLRDAAEDRLG